MSGKIEGATGIITVAVFGVSGSFAPADFTAWQDVLFSGAPLLLFLFLIWRIHRLDKQHSDCNKNWLKTQEQLALAYRAIQDTKVRRELPSEEDFLENNFCLDNHQKREK